MDDARVTELRVELPGDEVAVLDGHCQALGLDRTKVVREILRQWSDRELHRATVICRVAGRNPGSPESDRRGGSDAAQGEPDSRAHDDR